MEMKYFVLGRLKTTSRNYDKKNQIRMFGLRDKMFYLCDSLNSKSPVLTNRSDIDTVFVFKKHHLTEINPDDFIKAYKKIL